MEITKLVIEIGGVRDERDAARVMTLLQRVIKEEKPQDVPIVTQASNGAGAVALDVPDAILSAPLHELHIKPRVVKALLAAGFQTIGHIVPLTTNQIREVPDIGRAGLSSIDDALAELELCRPDWHHSR